MRYVAFEKEKYQRKELKIDLSKVNAILGTSINKEEYKKILLKLGFEIGENIKFLFIEMILIHKMISLKRLQEFGYNNILVNHFKLTKFITIQAIKS